MPQKDQVTLGHLGNEDKIKKCPECGSKDIEYQHGELICKKCGLVID